MTGAFDGKAVLVTGSTRGIGLATARAFLAAGARVAVNGRRESAVAGAIDTLTALGGGARLVAAPGSLDTVEGCRAVVEAAVAGLGGLDVLVNNAGIYEPASVEESDEALWDRTMALNVKGCAFCCQAALPALRAARGVIVNLGSDAGLRGYAEMSVYCAAKAAVVNLTRALALELAPEVRVNCVCPSGTDTEMMVLDFAGADPAGARGALEAGLPLRRLARPEEIAAAILFLASGEASYVNGAILPVDGGVTAGS